MSRIKIHCPNCRAINHKRFTPSSFDGASHRDDIVRRCSACGKLFGATIITRKVSHWQSTDPLRCLNGDAEHYYVDVLCKVCGRKEGKK